MKSSSSLPKKPAPELEPPVRVLLVDDDEDEYIITRRIISEIVGRTHLLDWVATYDDALNVIQEGRHDIYLVDYRLDEHTGLDLLREAVASGCNSPMILLTGQEDRAVDLEAMKAGAWDYLVKGRIDAAVLERAIRYTLEHKKVLDVLLESERQRERFIATLTHDMKTPIKAEFRIFELLLENRFGPLTDDQQTVISEMLRSNRFMYQMVDNLLTAFKFEEGQLLLRMEPTDLNELINSMVSMDLLGLAQDKEQTFTLELAKSLPPVPVDPLELKRVLYNLIQNAINYTQKGGHITVSTKTEGEHAIVTVADNGPGIDENFKKTLFEPYATNAKRYRHIGTGLGLYIARKIVEAHQGLITADSQADRGTEFTFTLPLHQEEMTRIVTL